MKMRIVFKIIFFCLLSIQVMSQQSFAWDPDTTHTLITEYAVMQSVLSPDHGDYLNNLGFLSSIDSPLKWDMNNNGQIEESEQLSVLQWMRDEGAVYEDGNAREVNHFHNPLKDWSSAGLGYLGISIWRSAILWAQDSARQASWPYGPMGPPSNECQSLICPQYAVPYGLSDWSWQTARNYYYLATTATSTTDREANFAKMFVGLGHQMHLLQDMSVPMHVRNDSHLFNRWIEGYVAHNISSVLTSTTIITIPNVTFAATQDSIATSPVANLFDTKRYKATGNPAVTMEANIGLAEYTNANFVSAGTISTGFLYPSLATSVTTTTILFKPGSSQRREYYWKTADGDSGYLLAGKPFILFEKDRILPGGDVTIHQKIPPMDENVHRGYAARLLPRAVGYSAALLNYFFRETLEISAPTTSVYAITDGSQAPYIDNYGNQHQLLTKIKAKVKNTTPNEAIGAGTLTAVAIYRMRTDYKPDLSADPTEEHPEWGLYEPNFSYSVSTPRTLTADEITSINGGPTEFAFVFPNNDPSIPAGIPAGITDLHLQIIFKGTIGNEADTAIAVGFKDLAEPAHHVFWNATDRFSLGSQGTGTTTWFYHLYTPEAISDPTGTLINIVDLDGDGIINELGEPDIRSAKMNFDIAYVNQAHPETPPQAVARVTNLPPGRFIRLIILQDRIQPRIVHVSYKDEFHTTISSYDDEFPEVINQKESDGHFYYMPVESFRHGESNVPILQHFHNELLGCYPPLFDPSTGEKYCPYPEAESPAVNVEPYGPVEILFNSQ